MNLIITIDQSTQTVKAPAQFAGHPAQSVITALQFKNYFTLARIPDDTGQYLYVILRLETE